MGDGQTLGGNGNVALGQLLNCTFTTKKLCLTYNDVHLNSLSFEHSFLLGYWGINLNSHWNLLYVIYSWLCFGRIQARLPALVWKKLRVVVNSPTFRNVPFGVALNSIAVIYYNQFVPKETEIKMVWRNFRRLFTRCCYFNILTSTCPPFFMEI